MTVRISFYRDGNKYDEFMLATKCQRPHSMFVKHEQGWWYAYDPPVAGRYFTFDVIEERQ